MKRNYNILFFLSFFIQVLCSQQENIYKSPRLTIVFVLDQFANHELQKFYPFLQGGIKFLYDHGIRYTNAFYPHGMPETGVGHTALGTGALPQDHGIIGNLWNDAQGKVVICDDDPSPDAAVFAPTGVYAEGKSAKNIMVDTLSDQIALNQTPLRPLQSIALSIKSRSAIGMAGRMGKAFWFDAESGNFTSSKAYFKQFPQWAVSFNDEKRVRDITSFMWKSLYPENHPAYNFPLKNDYQFTAPQKSMINVITPINKTEKLPYELFSKTPLANQLLLDFTEHCINEHLPHSDLIIWVSLSSLDLAGHLFGPYSFELMDMIYHIDMQLHNFINRIFQKVSPENTLMVLTADHGVFPILEMVHQQGFTLAQRTDVKALIQRLNQAILEKYNIENIIINFKMPQFYLDLNKLSLMDKTLQQALINDLKQLLRQEPSIREVWDFDELNSLPFSFNDVRNYLKSQLYRGRSGQLICLVHPYNYLDDYKSGTSHGTPYDYDTHVPLVLYQKGILENKTITKPVYMQQVPVTLSGLLKVPRPSASTFPLLPGLDPHLFALPSTDLLMTMT